MTPVSNQEFHNFPDVDYHAKTSWRHYFPLHGGLSDDVDSDTFLHLFELLLGDIPKE